MADINKHLLRGMVVVLFFAHCKKADNTTENMAPPNIPAKKYLALGDSYTKGESIAANRGFPYQLRDTINKSGRVAIEKLQIIAKTGWTTTHLLDAVNSTAFTDTFDLVTLLIGVNNQYQSKPIDLYDREFRQLLEKSIALAGGNKSNVAVISIPDYGATPYGERSAERIGKEIDMYNAISKRITDSLQVTYVDITPISRQAKTDPSLTAYDDLHPSAKMYGLWVALMYSEILEKLQ